MAYLPYSRTQQAVQNLGMTLRDLAGQEVASRSAESQHRLRLAELGLKGTELRAGQELGIIKELGAQSRAAALSRQRQLDYEAKRAHEQRLETTATERNKMEANKAEEERRRKEPITFGVWAEESVGSNLRDADLRASAIDKLRKNPVLAPYWDMPTTRDRAPYAMQTMWSIAEARARERRTEGGRGEKDAIAHYEKAIGEVSTLEMVRSRVQSALNTGGSSFVGDILKDVPASSGAQSINFFGDGSGKIRPEDVPKITKALDREIGHWQGIAKNYENEKYVDFLGGSGVAAEGARATNNTTGAEYEFRGGTWIPVE